MDLQTLTYLIVGGSFVLYIAIAIWARAGSTKDFYVAGGGVHPITNGIATAADWMSAASFISMAGLISTMGYGGTVFVMGYRWISLFWQTLKLQIYLIGHSIDCCVELLQPSPPLQVYLDGKDEKTVLLAFLKYIDNSILIAHHIDFDLEFLNKSLSTFTSLKILNGSIDTAKLAERIQEKTNPNLYREDRKQFQLDSLCKKYEIPSFARHHALSDAVTTGILFLKLQKKWIRMGNEQLKTLYF